MIVLLHFLNDILFSIINEIYLSIVVSVYIWFDKSHWFHKHYLLEVQLSNEIFRKRLVLSLRTQVTTCWETLDPYSSLEDNILGHSLFTIYILRSCDSYFKWAAYKHISMWDWPLIVNIIKWSWRYLFMVWDPSNLVSLHTKVLKHPIFKFWFDSRSN